MSTLVYVIKDKTTGKYLRNVVWNSKLYKYAPIWVDTPEGCYRKLSQVEYWLDWLVDSKFFKFSDFDNFEFEKFQTVYQPTKLGLTMPKVKDKLSQKRLVEKLTRNNSI